MTNISIQTDRPPPHNIEAEQAFLGAVLMNTRVAEECLDVLSADDFYHGAHGLIWGEITRRLTAGERTLTPVTLKGWADAAIPEAGHAYLVDLAASAVSIIAAPDFARVIADLAHKRRLIAIARNLEEQAFSADAVDSAQDIQARIEADLMASAAGADDGRGEISLSESVAKSVQRFNEAHRHKAPSGILFGLNRLDNILGGLKPHEFVVIGARPGVGKTAFSTALAMRAARQGIPTALFSMEMDAVEITDRIVASEARIPLSRLSGGKSSADEIDELVVAQKTLRDLPLIIDERARQTISSLFSRARRLKRRRNIGLIVVDYLQLISTAKADRRENKANEMSDITRGLKMIAKDLQIPVVALSQLSRQCESRADKRPLLSDLRESGSIEQDADKVMFLYREDYYRKPDGTEASGEVPDKFGRFRKQMRETAVQESTKNVLEVIVAKNRCGRCDTARLYYDTQTQRIDNLVEGASYGIV